jgi:hypothetical protein
MKYKRNILRGDHPCSSVRLSLSEFHVDRLGDNRALLMGVNEFLLILLCIS